MKAFAAHAWGPFHKVVERDALRIIALAGLRLAGSEEFPGRSRRKRARHRPAARLLFHSASSSIAFVEANPQPSDNDCGSSPGRTRRPGADGTPTVPAQVLRAAVTALQSRSPVRTYRCGPVLRRWLEDNSPMSLDRTMGERLSASPAMPRGARWLSCRATCPLLHEASRRVGTNLQDNASRKSATAARRDQSPTKEK